MTTYLLTWNPKRWTWKDLPACVKAGAYNDTWSCGVTKAIRPDDRVFLIKLGADEPRGIMGSGWARSQYFEGPHWNAELKAKGRKALYIQVFIDTLLDPTKGLFPRSKLKGGVYSKMRWEPQASGVVIPDHVAEQLEKDWAQYLKRPVAFKKSVYADDVDPNKRYAEGATKTITVNVYERSSEARQACIDKYGVICSVCGFNFQERYGDVGQGYIHVHHLKSLAEIKKTYKLNPSTDLRPVCPNCHAMLHQKQPPYSIQELRALLK